MDVSHLYFGAIAGHCAVLLWSWIRPDDLIVKASCYALAAGAVYRVIIMCLGAPDAANGSTLTLVASCIVTAAIIYRLRLKGDAVYYSTMAGLAAFAVIALNLSMLYPNSGWVGLSIIISAGIGLTVQVLTKSYFKSTTQGTTNEQE